MRSNADLQSATTSLEAFRTSLNCVGDEIFTVLDMLGGGASECCCSQGSRECPATAAAGSDGKHKSRAQAIPTSASGQLFRRAQRQGFAAIVQCLFGKPDNNSATESRITQSSHSWPVWQ